MLNRDGNYLEYIDPPKWLRSSNTTDESSTKFLLDTIAEKAKAKLTEKGEVKQTMKSDANQTASMEWMEATYEKSKNGLIAHRMLCEARNKIVAMSDEVRVRDST